MSDEIVNRLRCRYASGPIINGEPEFGWRDFGGPVEKLMLPTPLMKEAADEIERLRAEVAGLREELEAARQVMRSVRVFVTSREKIKHPEGTEWLDSAVTAIDAALAARKGEA